MGDGRTAEFMWLQSLSSLEVLAGDVFESAAMDYVTTMRQAARRRQEDLHRKQSNLE